MISATSFTLTGVVNKFITVLLNATLWNKHSSTLGMVAVCGCLIAGAFYEQAPMRDAAAVVSSSSGGKKTKQRRVKASVGENASRGSLEEKESLLELGESQVGFISTVPILFTFLNSFFCCDLLFL